MRASERATRSRRGKLGTVTQHNTFNYIVSGEGKSGKKLAFLGSSFHRIIPGPLVCWLVLYAHFS